MLIHEVQVAPTHQPLGLAKAMLDKALGKALELECSEVWVLTDFADIPVKRLYASRGGVEGPRNGVMFTFPRI